MKKSMYSRIRDLVHSVRQKESGQESKQPVDEHDRISTNLKENLDKIDALFENSNEYFVKHLCVGGTEVAGGGCIDTADRGKRRRGAGI